MWKWPFVVTKNLLVGPFMEVWKKLKDARKEHQKRLVERDPNHLLIEMVLNLALLVAFLTLLGLLWPLQ